MHPQAHLLSSRQLYFFNFPSQMLKKFFFFLIHHISFFIYQCIPHFMSVSYTHLDVYKRQIAAVIITLIVAPTLTTSK